MVVALMQKVHTFIWAIFSTFINIMFVIVTDDDVIKHEYSKQ